MRATSRACWTGRAPRRAGRRRASSRCRPERVSSWPADGIWFADPRAAASDPDVMAGRVSGGVRRRLRSLRSGADAHPAERRPVQCRRLRRDRCPAADDSEPAEAAAGSLCPLFGDARLRAARPDLSRVPADPLPRDSRLLPQVHRRRAHAADAAQSRVRCSTSTRRAAGRFSSLLPSSHEPELLGLALLFHDVGKWSDDDHAIESTRMAQAMLDRLDITGDDRRTVEFLIEHHLEMSRARLPPRLRGPARRTQVRQVRRHRRAA